MKTNMILWSLTLCAMFGKSLQIFGGKPATEGQFPFVVQLFVDGEATCAGSIISENAILTAGTCVINYRGEAQPPEKVYAIAGTVNKTSPPGVKVDIEKILLHPQLNDPKIGRFNGHDLAVLVTKEAIPLDDRVATICIADHDTGSLIGRAQLVAMGWGLINRRALVGDPPENIKKQYERAESLQYTNQTERDMTECAEGFLDLFYPDTVMCVNGQKDSQICSGDMGGPLVYYSGNQPVQVGIAEEAFHITGCGFPASQTLFTRVSDFTDYIKTTVAGIHKSPDGCGEPVPVGDQVCVAKVK